MRTCQKCLGMMFLERAIDMVDGLVGYFYACVNCGKREGAEEGVRYLCEEGPSRILVVGAAQQVRVERTGEAPWKRNGKSMRARQSFLSEALGSWRHSG